MKIKVNDNVIVLKGKDRNKKGKISQILPKEGLVVVDGVNKMYKNIRARKKNESGQRIEFFGPVKIANVMVVCPKCSKPMRVRINLTGNKKHRECSKCKEIID